MTKNLLKQFFPVLKTEKEILAEICSKPELFALFTSWTEYQQKE
ncbi:hypothetical protein SAMN02910398_00705, partial [Butyrivibrio sp. YAB3001]